MIAPYRIVGRIKGLLFVAAVAIIITLLWHTQNLVKGLRQEARNVILFYAQLHARAVNNPDDSDLNFIFDAIINRTDFPIILASPQGEPIGWEGIEVPPDSVYSERAHRQVRKIMAAMRREVDPVPITYQDPVSGRTDTLNYLYYGDSRLIEQLQRLPYLAISVVSLFVLVGFLGFNSIRRGEQQFIWIGLSKETAHQLGTPISSLLGWIELLKTQLAENSARETIREMERDLERLNKVAARFSQIGSSIDLKEQDLGVIVEEVVRYFRNRLPQMRRAVRLEIHKQELPLIPLNRDLIEWVLENLIKNAIDAIESAQGNIIIELQAAARRRHRVIIDIIDNGKGIDPADRKNIFRPGFSTKKRGWGLGLSLAKRIVEEYHRGRLFVKESRLGEGTTMRIIL